MTNFFSSCILLLMIFEQLSYVDLRKVVLVSRRWKEIGETQRLWSSLPVIVNTGNMSVMPEILSSRRMQELKKLVIEAPLSNKVSHTIVRHPGLRQFKLINVVRMIKETIISVLTV